ncbi:GNAT family N-acetyltransferase [Streptomyces gamaensis]|uniref:GNAT family N-acetyltransferase n=1 Tax=Streptomyces gamaensis TaxID=1763542 RepID=A0ABW0Z7Y3_9ACTN
MAVEHMAHRAQQGITVEHLEAPAAARAEEAFRRIYAEAFAEPPYRETEDDVAATFHRFRTAARERSFRAALARTHTGEPVGMALGRLLADGGQHGFDLLELAVRAPWRGQGIARRLHDAVVESTGAEYVRLNVHPEAGAAQAAYRAWGYRKTGRARPVDGAELHDTMLLVIHK